MDITQQLNIGAFLKLVRAAALTSATAAGSGDNTLVTGTTIDLWSKTLFPGGPPKSLALGLNYTTTLASGETLGLGTVLIETGDASNLSDATTLTSAASGTVETGGSGGSTNTGMYQLSANLETAKRYLRCKFTPDLSRGGTDTAQISASFAFAGFAQLPNA